MNGNASDPRTTREPSTGVEGPSPSAGVDPAAERRVGPITVRRALAVTAAASLLIGIIVGPIISGHPSLATDTTSAAEHTVTVTGAGEVSVAPDVADIVLGVVVQKSTVAAAQSAAATLMSSVIAAVKKDGVDAKDIVTVNVSLNPVYDYGSNGSTPRLIGQQFSNTVKVTVRDIKSVAAIVDDSIAAGATTVGGISFRVNDPKAVQAQARGQAMADARAKADALTSAAGVSIKGVAAITETTSQPTPVYYSGAADAKAAQVSTPIQTGTTDVLVQVTVTYLIG